MSEKVSQYLKEAKDKGLIKRGLYELEEVKDIELIQIFNTLSFVEFDERYPNYLYENKKYYKKIPCEVTKEEYEEILKVSYSEEKDYLPSTTSNVLFVLGIITIAIGVLIGISAIDTNFGIPLVLSSIPSGLSLIALAKVIELLNDIKHY